MLCLCFAYALLMLCLCFAYALLAECPRSDNLVAAHSATVKKAARSGLLRALSPTSEAQDDGKWKVDTS